MSPTSIPLEINSNYRMISGNVISRINADKILELVAQTKRADTGQYIFESKTTTDFSSESYVENTYYQVRKELIF